MYSDTFKGLFSVVLGISPAKGIQMATCFCVHVLARTNGSATKIIHNSILTVDITPLDYRELQSWRQSYQTQKVMHQKQIISIKLWID